MNLNDFFRSSKFRILLCTVALLTGVLLYSVKQGSHTDFLSRTLATVCNPVRRFSASISSRVTETLDTYYHAKAYREENALLREQIASLNQRLIAYDDAERELEALRDQLAIQKKSNDFVLSEPCNVISTITNDLSGSFVIDQGSEDGILLNAPVICSLGLIGVVTEISPQFATVTTILSPDLSVGAVILETGDTGIVEGSLKYAVDGQTKMIYLDEAATVGVGNLVITAGTTGLFPYGLVIGNVTESGMEETGLTAFAAIQPTVDFSALETVTVLLDFKGKGVSFHED